MIDSKKQNSLKKTNLIQAGIKAQQQGNHKLALKRFRKAIEKNPKNRVAYMLIDKVLRELGKIEEANKYYYQLSETTPEVWEEEYILGLRVGYINNSILIPLDIRSTVHSHKGGIKTSINCPFYFYHLRGDFTPITDINYLEQQDHQPNVKLKLHGSYLYAGFLLPHFGHYMSECTHRLWAYSKLSSQIPNIAIIPRPTKKIRENYKLSPYVEQAMTYMQIPLESVHLITKVTEVEHLVVPEQASTLNHKLKLSSSYLDFLSENEEKFFHSYQPQNSNYPEKLYVSRSHLIDKGIIAGEAYMENLLQKYENFHIFKPENYSLHEQMNFYRHAKVCIFSEGSAIHGLELLGRLNKMSKVAIILRRENKDDLTRVIASRTQNLCKFKATKVIHPLLNHTTKVPWIANAVSIFSNIDLLIQFFRDNNLAQLKNFSLNDFYQQEAMDILQHVMQVKIDNNRFNSDADFFSYFSKFRNDIRKYSQNPYLK